RPRIRRQPVTDSAFEIAIGICPGDCSEIAAPYRQIRIVLQHPALEIVAMAAETAGYRHPAFAQGDIARVLARMDERGWERITPFDHRLGCKIDVEEPQQPREGCQAHRDADPSGCG